MEVASPTRRLAAIVCMDVAGYSRLMGADEEGTLARLNAIQREVIDPAIAEHRGRLVKTTGDGFLAEFASVVDAVRCAAAIQHQVIDRAGAEPETRRIALRIGVNLGDVIAEGGDLHGDGVNVAARLEALAEPGAICLSGAAYEQVRDRVDLAFTDIGEQALKNIARPVRVWCARAGERKAEAARTPPPLPDKPSIAVLPFENMSGDPEQEYFADGIVEDIITALSRIQWLFVIARNSRFTYKGKAVDVKQVGRELGVRYVLEGSVRKASNRVRIAGQLIDATTGGHVWADRFDGALDDIFDLQDRVTASVAGIIEPKLRHAEIERARRKPTESLDAYDLYLRALAQFLAGHEESYREALRLLYRVVEIDPQYAVPYALAAFCHLTQRSRGWMAPSDPAVAKGIRMAKLAASLGQDDPDALWMAGHALAQLSGDLQGGIALIDRALTLNPNSANAWRVSGMDRALLGESDLAIAHLERSARLSPLDAFAFLRSIGFVVAYFMAGRYEEASAWCDTTLHEQPDSAPALRFKAAICGLLGRLEEGREGVERLLAVNPDATVSAVRPLYAGTMKAPGRLDALLDGLRKAGLPE